MAVPLRELAGAIACDLIYCCDLSFSRSEVDVVSSIGDLVVTTGRNEGMRLYGFDSSPMRYDRCYLSFFVDTLISSLASPLARYPTWRSDGYTK